MSQFTQIYKEIPSDCKMKKQDHWLKNSYRAFTASIDENTSKLYQFITKLGVYMYKGDTKDGIYPEIAALCMTKNSVLRGQWEIKLVL